MSLNIQLRDRVLWIVLVGAGIMGFVSWLLSAVVKQGYPIRASFSPDGTQLVVDALREKLPHIYLLGMDGKGLRRVTNDHRGESGPAFSPDGKQIVYGISTPDDRVQLSVVNSDGTTAHQITSNAYVDGMPSFSPDGNHIVFKRAYVLRGAHMGGYRWYDWDVVILDMHSHKERRVTHRSYYGMSAPYFSPDGESILYSALELNAHPGREQIYRVGVDGGKVEQLTFGERESRSPAVSRDGKRIVFVSDRASPHKYEVWSMGANGDDPKQLTSLHAQCDNPQFTPDGKTIIFFRDEKLNDLYDLWQIDTEGAGLKCIVDRKMFFR